MCSTKADFIVVCLQEQIDYMNQELESWNYNVKCMRNTYYELNYYTTSQLLILRQALVKLKRDEAVPLETEVLFLLQSIYPETKYELVTSAIKVAMKDTLKSKDVNMSDIKDHMPNVKVPQFVESPHKEAAKYWWPSLAKDDLSSEQKRTMAYVIDSINCDEKIVLKAFEDHKDEKLDKYDYEELCSTLQMNYEGSDDTDESSDESESFQSDDDGDDESVHEAGITLQNT